MFVKYLNKRTMLFYNIYKIYALFTESLWEVSCMTEKEKMQEIEIERLKRKLQKISEAYQKTAAELEALKKENIKKTEKKRGRPVIDEKKRVQILSLCQMGNTMREIAGKTEVALSTVHKVITEASKESRSVYVYMNRKEPATIIDTNGLKGKVRIENITDDILSRAFGVEEKPDWEDYLEFMEERCMPRTRYGVREELKSMGIDSYDPFLIIEKTDGRVYGDGQWLKKMPVDWIVQYDDIVKQNDSGQGKKQKLKKLIQENSEIKEYIEKYCE